MAATRTWVSGVGDDVNPASRTAPCKTFAGAISKTAAGGEISVLDPGGYGSLTITKSITVDGEGTTASILAAGTNGITVNAAVGDVVILRNLSINGAGTGLNGIRFLAGATLHIVNCKIFGFTQRGLDVLLSNTGRLFVTDTEIVNCAGDAIRFRPSAGIIISASLERVRTEKCNTGVHAESGSRSVVRNSVFSGHSIGVFAERTGTDDPQVTMHDCKVSDNVTGIQASSGSPTVRISECIVVNNGTGLAPSGSASIISFGGNIVASTGVNGAPTSTQAPV